MFQNYGCGSVTLCIYYRITAKKLCFSYEQFVNDRAAGPNAPAAPFFVCIWKRCKGSWRE